MSEAPVPVLILIRELGLGGSERQAAEVARSLDPARYQAHVGCFQPGGFRAQELGTAGVPVVHIPMGSFLSPSLVTGAIVLGRYLREHRIQIVHTFDVPTTIFGVPAARFHGTRVVLSSQRAYRSLAPGLARRKLLRMTDRLAHGIVVNCRAVERHLIDDEKVSPDRIRLCYNGLDTAAFSPDGPAKQPRGASGTVMVGVVCALRPEKNLRMLIEAFATVSRSHPQARLTIVGSGPVLPELEQQARSLGVTAAVHFEPATREVAPWLRSFDIFVLPSVSEAFSNSLMEAMACGCCPVATRVGGNPELVEHERRGLTVGVDDTAGLASALARLIDNRAEREAFAFSAAGFVRENLALPVMASRMMAIYDESRLARS